MAKIKGAQINNIHSGGIADSLYSGIPNSVSTLIGFDIHSRPGSIFVNQKLSKLDDIDEFCRAILPCSDGKVYFFSAESGKIWSRTTAGTIALETTAAPAAGNAGIVDAYEYAGYIYYAMELRLGRVAVGADWSTRNDSFQTFSVGNALHHPMEEVNQVLYIGDSNMVAQVDDTGTFVSEALDLSAEYEITALGRANTDLAIGAGVSDKVNKATVFLWNTWSVSFSVQDDVNEVGINAFIPADNFTLVSAGVNGNLYLLNGYQLELFKRIPGDYSPTSKMKMYSNARDYFNGVPILGISNNVGNPCSQGVYSFGARQAGYNKVLNFEYPISQRNTGEYVLSNIEVGAIKSVGNDLFVSWRDSTGSPVSGVDMLDYSSKLEYGLLESRVMKVERWMANSFRHWYVGYELFPEDTSVEMYYRANFGDWSSDIELVHDAIRNMFMKDLSVTASTMQVRLKVLTDGNNSPIIDEIMILFE